MRRHPLFAATVVGTLALTIGGNATMFGVLDALLLTPLPYPEADAIVYMTESFREDQTKSVSYLNYLDWKERNSSFEDVGAQTGWGFTLTGSGDARVLPDHGHPGPGRRRFHR